MMFGVRELLIILLCVIFLAPIVALFLPRTRVSATVKRWILGIWVALGIIQIVEAIRHGSDSTLLYGVSEVMMFGAGFWMLTDIRWKRRVGGVVIFLGAILLLCAGVLISHG